MSAARAVIFDGDDTLWWTEPMYDHARQAVRELVELAGLDGEAWEARERARDVENVATFGLGRARFPTSCVEAYHELAISNGTTPDEQLDKRIWEAADRVFTEHAPLADGAREVLAELRPGHILALLTKGDVEVQQQRIQHSGLSSYFDCVDVVPLKDARTFAAMAARIGVPPAACWSVGNSWASDIAPAAAIEMRAVWIPAHVWEYEQHLGNERHDLVVRVHSLWDALTVIQHGATGRGRD
jgi:putative hydrolase of the HAD superfamily